MAALPAAAQAQSVGKQMPAITHNTWTSGTPMSTGVWCSMAAVLKDEIYVVGGENAASTIVSDTQIYNPATTSWSTGVSLPTPLCDGAAAVVDSVLYIIGGSQDGTTSSDAVWAYSPKTKVWSSKAPMPTARESIGVAVEKNIIYIIGGVVDGSRLNTVESYNPATNTWTEEAPLLAGKSEPSIGLVGTTIVTADGDTSSGDNGNNESYDATTNTWTSLKSDPTGRNAACGHGIGAYLYVAGGYAGGSPGTPAFNLTESFHLAKNTWKTLASMPQAELFGSSAVYKGQMYCIGGWAEYEGTVLDNLQIYQP
jgi:N-acetylneuraminic acid mutarotase